METIEKSCEVEEAANTRAKCTTRTIRQRRGVWDVAGTRARSLCGGKRLNWQAGLIRNDGGQRNSSWIRRQKRNSDTK